MNNYNELKTCLKDLKDKILQKEERKRTLMDITGIDHLENNWSKIYAYFFDSQEDHHMGSKFVKALLEVCGIDNNFLDNPYVYLEQPGEDNKRMDILLVQGEHAVIIENKVHHVLNNDLSKYYAEVRKNCNDVKVVVLGLHKYYVKSFEDTNKDEKIQPLSITHLDLMEEMNKEFEANIDNEQWKFNYLFKEFYQNIKNMTNTITEELKFFSNNDKNQIRQIANVYNDIISHFRNVMIGEGNETFKIHLNEYGLALKEDIGYDYIKYRLKESDKTQDGKEEVRVDPNIMITAFYRDQLLFNKTPHVHFVIELQKKYMKIVEDREVDYKNLLVNYNNLLVDYKKLLDDVEIKYVAISKESRNEKEQWRHFASLSIGFKDLNDAKDELERKLDIALELLSSIAKDIKSKINEQQ